jgi:RimJ/RimL family protein N-acetyltransferase
MRVITTGRKVILRTGHVSDIDVYMSWMKGGEWLKYDAPWETDFKSLEVARERFIEKFLADSSLPFKRAIICAKAEIEKPIGWLNRYDEKRFPDAWLIGIDICEDDYLNKGFGTEAFKLWIDYLFSNSDVHRLGFNTYSFNERMVRVGEKLGFTHEGTDREVVFWQNKWIDRLHFGLLRKEWDSLRRC